MNGFRKLTAALVLTACAAGATQIPRLMSGGNSSAREAGSTLTSSSGTRSTDTQTATHTEIGHDGQRVVAQSGRATQRGGVIPTKTFVSAARIGATKNIGVPASVDLRQWAMPIANQGQLSSCVTWTVDYALLGWYARHDGHSGAPFAPMYTYSQINHGVDKGSQPQDALAVALNQGSDTKAHYNHGDADWQTQPTAAERMNAAAYKIRGYHTLFSGSKGQGQAGVNTLANSLAASTPVAISLPIRTGFNDLTAGHIDNDNTSGIRGYHEVLAIGYDQSGLLIQNSWGTGWGDGGFGRIAWNVVGTDVMTAHTADGFATSNTTTTTTTTKPAMGAVEVSIPGGKSVSNTVPVNVKWSASATSGVARYVIWTSMNGGAWVDTTSRLSTSNATSVTLLLTPGTSYRFGVAAIDTAGNRSDYGYSAVFSPKVFDDNTVSTTGFKRYNWTSAYGGQGLTSSTAGATAQFTFTGRGVALVAPKFSTAGQANVFVDGKFVQTIDLYNASLASQTTTFAWYWNANGTHTVTVKVVGTAGRPRVDVDAFAVIG